jgi:flagellar biosynthesis/type III secretory pathway protein FliH
MAIVIKQVRITDVRTIPDMGTTHHAALLQDDMSIHAQAVAAAHLQTSDTIALTEHIELQDDGEKLIYNNELYIRDAILQKQLQAYLDAEQEKLATLRETIEQQAYQVGLEAGKAEYTTQIGRLQELVSSVNSSFGNLVSENINLVKDAIFVALCRVFGDFVKSNEARVAAINQVIAEISTKRPYVVRVSPVDYAAIMREYERTGQRPETDFVGDERVELGGCIIETDSGIFDGRLEVQLAYLREAIRMRDEQ